MIFQAMSRARLRCACPEARGDVVSFLGRTRAVGFAQAAGCAAGSLEPRRAPAQGSTRPGGTSAGGGGGGA